MLSEPESFPNQMEMSTGYVSPPLEIERSFLDHNGHVNMAYHLVMVDRALERAFERIKGPDYIATRGMTTFAAEVHVRYLKEIRYGDEVRGHVRWVAGDSKRAHWAVALIRASDGDILTTVEGVSLSISVDTRKVTPFPEDTLRRLEAEVAGDASTCRELGWIGRRVGMTKN